MNPIQLTPTEFQFIPLYSVFCTQRKTPSKSKVLTLIKTTPTSAVFVDGGLTARFKPTTSVFRLSLTDYAMATYELQQNDT